MQCLTQFSTYLICVVLFGYFLFLDRVYRSDCSTRQVYEEGAKEVALVVVSGINGEHVLLLFSLPLFLFHELCLNTINICIILSASVFAYGQTSSGKTYTMSGITEYTVADIYDYIEKVIKILGLVSLIFSYAFCYFPWVPLI